MNKKVVFPGTFDPFTLGHLDIVDKVSPLFDEVIILLAVSRSKKPLIPLEKRKELIEKALSSYKNIVVDSFSGVLVDYLKQNKIKHVVRGIRTGSDFLFEEQMVKMNKFMHPDHETIFFLSSPDVSHISSTFVREIHLNGGDASSFIPKDLAKYLKES